MLLELRVENYRSIADEQVLLLSAGKDDSLLQNIHPAESTGGWRLLKSAVLYGPNGGGKSNLIRAAGLMRHMVVESATSYQAGEALPLEPFRLDPERASGPSKLEMTFLHHGVRYQYGFSADSKRVHEEWLLAYPEGRAQTWFERSQDGWSFGPNLKGEKKRIAEMTRDNALFLSVTASLNQQQLMTVFEWFVSRLRVLVAHEPWRKKERRGYVSASSFTMHTAAKDPDFKDKVARFLRAADLGIEDFEVEFRNIDEGDLPSDVPEDMRKELLALEVGRVRTCRRTSEGTRVWFDLDDESDATQSLFGLVGPWLDTIASGYVLLVDTVFSALHPMLTRELLARFHDAGGGEKPAQVVMTTHDTSLLDREILRRDQVWFIEKGRGGASRLYALLDYKPRKDEALQRGYLAGRYGALPYLGELEL